MRIYRFSKYVPAEQTEDAGFEQLLKIFLDLVTMASGDVNQALSWMNDLNNQYNFTSDGYGMWDFYEDLKNKGYIEENKENGELEITAKSEKNIRKKSLQDVFGKLKKGKSGNHKTFYKGNGDEKMADPEAKLEE